MIALEPYDKGLLGTTLRYPYEVRNATDYFADLPELIAPDMRKLAGRILDSKAGNFDPTAFRDRYEEALLAHLKARQAGAVQAPKPTFAAPRRVTNLMEALRRSIAEDEKQLRARNGASAAPGARVAVRDALTARGDTDEGRPGGEPGLCIFRAFGLKYLAVYATASTRWRWQYRKRSLKSLPQVSSSLEHYPDPACRKFRDARRARD